MPSCALIFLSFASPAFATPLSCLREHELAHAGGWGADHPGAIYIKRCGMTFPMPPHKFKLTQQPVIHYVDGIMSYCGYAQACSTIGGAPAVIWLPKQSR